MLWKATARPALPTLPRVPKRLQQRVFATALPVLRVFGEVANGEAANEGDAGVAALWLWLWPALMLRKRPRDE
eukprot:7681603-Lingulodinium_polyedra.AAC.1